MEQALARPVGRPKADPRDKRIEALQAQVERLRAELGQTHQVIEVQGTLIRPGPCPSCRPTPSSSACSAATSPAGWSPPVSPPTWPGTSSKRPRAHGIDQGTLTQQADHGSSMTSKTLAVLHIDLGVTKSHSRPRTSNDNPHVEASFKTLKSTRTNDRKSHLDLKWG
ncbi:hypothetical protein [Actinomadura luzonensis]|uniref:hypothetical protein n=1 Tax=Actinomadura luzonensis TaxID=2805427 RepID=UPI00389968B3